VSTKRTKPGGGAGKSPAPKKSAGKNWASARTKTAGGARKSSAAKKTAPGGDDAELGQAARAAAAAGGMDAGKFVDMIAKGATLANAAAAAGSQAQGRAARKQAGHKLLKRLRERGVILEAFNRVGLTLDVFAKSVRERLDAQTRHRGFFEGTPVESEPFPDQATRTAAAAQYMRAVGMDRIPQEVPTDPDPLAGVSDAELVGLRELLEEEAE
jgi:hypothetical protein